MSKRTRALLQHRNTPCAITGLSPAQIVFGRVLKDFLPLQPGKFIPRQEWRQAADDRAASYAKRIMSIAAYLSHGSRFSKSLKLGQRVLIQDQNKTTPKFKQWTRTGIIINIGLHNDYHVSLDGSRLITKRNRQLLRPIQTSPDVFNHVPERPLYRSAYSTVTEREPRQQ